MEKHWSLICLPDDTGVKNVNGRIGAAQGPEMFLKYLERLKGNPDVQAKMQNGGFFLQQPTLHESHNHAAELIANARQKSNFTIIVGGGHDLVYPHLCAYKNGTDSAKKLGCINIDVHLDLRPDQPVITSGSPFFMALQAGMLEGVNLIEFGIQEYANAEELFDYANSKNVSVVKFDDLRHQKASNTFKQSLEFLSERTDQIVISLDLDSIQAAFAPGVSAPAPEGFMPSEVIEMVRLAAANEKVVSLGIYELNPLYDVDDRTARLAAVLAYQFASVKLSNQIAL